MCILCIHLCINKNSCKKSNMSGVNKVILVGRLGKDPEFKTLDNGTPLARFPLATSETYKDKSGEKKEITDWHNIIVWRGLAEVVNKYLKKGNMVYLEGKNKTREWDKDGQKHYTTEVVISNMVMLNTNNHNGAPLPTEEHAPQSGVEDAVLVEDESDDLPF